MLTAGGMMIGIRSFAVGFCCIFVWLLSSLSAWAAADAAGAQERLLQAPQSMGYFAKKVGEDRLLLSAEEQARRDSRCNEIVFGPWTQVRPSVNAAQFRNMLIKKARGFCLDKPWTQPQWDALLRNANAAGYPSALGAAIVVQHADMRSLPTEKPLFMEASPVPAVDFFDFFQLSSLPLGAPVYISHSSKDKLWHYVESPLVSGWVRAEALALVDKNFRKNYRRGPFAVVLRDNLPLHGSEGQVIGTAHVGSIFPLAQTAGALLVPVAGKDGMAELATVRPPEGTFLPKPLPLTAGALARLGDAMLGQVYAWGGSGQSRDCSLAMRDLFLPFGIWLPRNSRTQTSTPASIKLEKLPPAARKERVLRDGKPFLTLLGFPGHVGLYVGTHEGEPVMLHNILGLRTNNAEEWYRHIIGRCILSTLEPGKNMPELQLSETLLDRLRSMRLVP